MLLGKKTCCCARKRRCPCVFSLSHSLVAPIPGGISRTSLAPLRLASPRNYPRLRALALLGRRSHQRVEVHVMPPSKKPARERTRQRMSQRVLGRRAFGRNELEQREAPGFRTREFLRRLFFCRSRRSVCVI